MGMNTTDFLSIGCAICPGRDLVVFDGERATFEQTDERVNRLTNALRELGLRKGDRIGMLQVNCREYVEAYFAAARIGAIFVPLNFRAKSSELTYMISNAEAELILAGNRYLGMINRMAPELPTVKHLVSLESKEAGSIFYEDLLQSSPPDEYITEINDDDITILMYTCLLYTSDAADE